MESIWNYCPGVKCYQLSKFPWALQFLTGKAAKSFSQAKDTCSLTDFLVWLNTSISTSLPLHSTHRGGKKKKRREKERFWLTVSLLFIFSSKSLTPIIPLRHMALQPTKPIWQSKKGSPIIRTYKRKGNIGTKNLNFIKMLYALLAEFLN